MTLGEVRGIMIPDGKLRVLDSDSAKKRELGVKSGSPGWTGKPNRVLPSYGANTKQDSYSQSPSI